MSARAAARSPRLPAPSPDAGRASIAAPPGRAKAPPPHVRISGVSLARRAQQRAMAVKHPPAFPWQSLAAFVGDRLCLRRVRIAVAQLRDIRKLRLTIAQLAFDTHAQSQALGWRIGREHYAFHPRARLVVATILVRDLGHPEAGQGIAGLRR